MEVKSVKSEAPYDELFSIIEYLISTEDKVAIKHYQDILEELKRTSKLHTIKAEHSNSDPKSQNFNDIKSNVDTSNEKIKLVKNGKVSKPNKTIKKTSENADKTDVLTKTSKIELNKTKQINKTREKLKRIIKRVNLADKKPPLKKDDKIDTINKTSGPTDTKKLPKLSVETKAKKENKVEKENSKSSAPKPKPVRNNRTKTNISSPSESENDDDSKDFFSNLTDFITDDEDQDKTPKNEDLKKKLDVSRRLKLDLKEKEIPKNNSKFQCKECEYHTDLKRRFEAHIKTHKYKQFKCIQCDEDFILEETYKQHMERHIKNFSCDLCDKQFSKEISLMNHKINKHPETLLSEQPPPPAVPEKVPEQPDNQENKQPIKTVHTPTSIKIRKCPKCNFWTNALQMATHLETHENGNEATSEPSNEVDGSAANQKTEQIPKSIQENTEDSSTTCPQDKSETPTNSNAQPNVTECSEMANQPSDQINNGAAQEKLPEEMNNNLPQETKQFVCNLCQKIFPYSFSLRKHRYLHTGQKIRRCRQCKYKCLSSMAMARHATMHARSYRCTRCRSRFASCNQLRKHHLRIHNSQRSCAECLYKTAHYKLLKIHQAKFHPPSNT